MDNYGRIAVLVDSNDDYFYYYQLDEERVVRITEDGVAKINAYWDIDVLTDDLDWIMKERGFEVEYMDDDLLDFYINDEDLISDTFNDIEIFKKVVDELKKYKETKNDIH